MLGRMTVALVCVATAFVCAATRPGAAAEAPTSASAQDYVLLVPDSRNNAIYEIAADGSYLGDFLTMSPVDDDQDLPRLWNSPRAVLYVEGEPGRLWLAAERSLTEWSMDGRYLRTIFADTVELEDPAGIARIGDEVFVLSEDKSRVMVFDAGGKHLRSFGYHMLQNSKDMKVGPDGKLWVAGQMFGGRPGLISIWDPNSAEDAPPLEYRVPPELTGTGTWWLSSFALDGHGGVLVTEYSRGRLERWDLKSNERLEVLMEQATPGIYRKLATGPDGMVYLAGAEGIYRFPPEAHAVDLKDLKPFFSAASLADRVEEPFTPTQILFVPRVALTQRQAAATDSRDR